MSLESKVVLEILRADGVRLPANLDVTFTSGWHVRLENPGFQDIVVQGEDLFSCLCSLREKLEEQSMLLLCVGARTDVWPSSLSRQMGGGRKAYILKMGIQAREEDLVDILLPASEDQVGSVREQKLHYETWFDSL